jgi:hypothetical protein
MVLFSFGAGSLWSRAEGSAPTILSPSRLVGKTFEAHDSICEIDAIEESRDDARSALAGLYWAPSPFTVTCEPSDSLRFETLVRFDSPIHTGNAPNDRVALEWHAARNADGECIHAPAVLVVHESGRKMPVGKTFAMLIARHGVHAFMIHLPAYGVRVGEGRPSGSANMIRLTRQAITDIRRARDAIAVLPDVDNRVIAIQGTSLGGFLSSTAASLDDGFDAIFLMLCGGDLHGVLEHGKRDAAKMREQLAAEGLVGDSLKELLAIIEPTRVCHRLDPQQTWLYSGRFDDVVPLSHSELLANKIGLNSEHHILFDADHYSGVTHIPSIVKQIHDEVLRLANESTQSSGP